MSIKTKYNSLKDLFNGNKKVDANQVIYRTNNKSEYQQKKLEKQQTSFFRRQIKKMKNVIQRKVIVNESRRLPSYIDYDLMDTYPIIHQALNIYMEEATVLNKEGKILTIQSESEQIKKELETLFEDVLNIQLNLPMWTREMAKNGDCFLLLELDDEDGVIGIKNLPTSEVDRVEAGCGSQLAYLSGDDNEDYFIWKGESIVKLENYRVAHFRLLADGKKYPYGTSILEGARSVWKNLILVEDAMRTIRLIRGMDRHIHYVYVGALDSNDVPAFVDTYSEEYKRTKHVDPTTGQVDLKQNVMAYDQDIVIPYHDEKSKTTIDTLQGSSNVGEVGDIEYDLNQLFTALGIAKPFLIYSETAGDGKNLSNMDIRLAKKVRRVQQAMIMELNKIAITHLYLLGYDESELGNFSISMENPSKQEQLMELELLNSQLEAYDKMVSDAGNGFGVKSMTMALKEIFDMTDDEIKLNLEQQFMEKAASMQIAEAQTYISSPPIFQNLLDLYGDNALGIESQIPDEEGGDSADSGGGGAGGGFGGGGGFIGGDVTSDADLDLDVDGDGEFSDDEFNDALDDLGGDAEGAENETEQTNENHKTDTTTLLHEETNPAIDRVSELISKIS